MVDINLTSTPADVQAVLADLETVYVKRRAAIDAEAKRQKAELQAWRIKKRQRLRAVLKYAETPPTPSTTPSEAAK